MAGNGKRTVVSLKKYEVVVEAARKMQSDLKKLSQENQVLRSMVDSKKLRPELLWFSSEMERVLSYHDNTKGNSYRQMKAGQFADKIIKKLVLLPAAVEDPGDSPPGLLVKQANEETRAYCILRIAVHIANYSMMMGEVAMAKAGKLTYQPYLE